MLHRVRLAIAAITVFATGSALSSRADAMVFANPASVLAAVVAATNFAQPEQVRGFRELTVSCNLRIPCPLPNISYGRVQSRASDRYFYESCRCDLGNNSRECAPITSCYAEGGRCRGSCPSQSGVFPHPAY
jgi:hypothetical protein